jgi:hypothetical protein
MNYGNSVEWFSVGVGYNLGRMGINWASLLYTPGNSLGRGIIRPVTPVILAECYIGRGPLTLKRAVLDPRSQARVAIHTVAEL